MRHKLHQLALIFLTPARRMNLSLCPSRLEFASAFASPAFEASGFPSFSATLILTIRLAAPAVAWNSLCSQPVGLLCPGSRSAGQGPQAASSTPQGCESYSVCHATLPLFASWRQSGSPEPSASIPLLSGASAVTLSLFHDSRRSWLRQAAQVEDQDGAVAGARGQ